MSMDLTIDVYFDFVCPWCLIGKRHLEKALAQFELGGPAVDIRLNWRGVQLVPEVPAPGWPFAEFYAARLGSEAAVAQRRQQVEESAARTGLHLRLSDITTFPNTAKAHALLDYVQNHGTVIQRNTLIERLFGAYFMNAENIGEEALLLDIARQSGIDSDAFAQHLSTVERMYAPAMIDVGAVPRFVFNGRVALEGAQSVASLLQAMRAAVQVAGGVKGRPQ